MDEAKIKISPSKSQALAKTSQQLLDENNILTKLNQKLISETKRLKDEIKHMNVGTKNDLQTITQLKTQLVSLAKTVGVELPES